MNLRLIVVALAAVLCYPCCAQSRVDIDLVGPWILYQYQDKNLAGGKTVLVAITAGGITNDNDNLSFHSIDVSAGDGYYIYSPGVYCLTFDGGKCGLPAGNSSLVLDTSYPKAPGPLPVTATSQWDWASLSQSKTYATSIILPMPASYSEDGAWHMRFGKTFDSSGQTYSANEDHSIGVQLHYVNGPSDFGLLACSTPITDANCKLQAPIQDTDVKNSGTLHVEMKSPDNNNACDPHVRRAYPKMLALLGPLTTTNPTKAVIDPAKGTNAYGSPTYDQAGDSYRCLDHDDQANTGTAPPMAMGEPLTQQIEEILSALSALCALEPTEEQKKGLLLSCDPNNPTKPSIDRDIARASEGLDNSFPRISQLRLIQRLVQLSLNGLNELSGQLDSAKNLDRRTGLQTQLFTLEKKESKLVDGPPTKNGSDCKAPVMLVQ